MMKEKIYKIGFDSVQKISVSDISFEPSLIDLCKQNHCGNYGKCYTCPPLVGSTDELIQRAKKFNTAIIFQKIYSINDSFDIEGMTKGKKDFNDLVQKVNDICREELSDCLVLCAGGCNLCDKCGAINSVPCRFPQKATPSLESYAINVSKLAKACGMKYINGVNTVTYFGGILY